MAQPGMVSGDPTRTTASARRASRYRGSVIPCQVGRRTYKRSLALRRTDAPRSRRPRGGSRRHSMTRATQHGSLMAEPDDAAVVVRIPERILDERTVRGIRRQLAWLVGE